MFKNKSEFKKDYARRIVEKYGCDVNEAHNTELYITLAKMVRDFANVNWHDTRMVGRGNKVKQTYYFSIEFLLGRLLTSNLQNLGIYETVVEGLKDLGIDYKELADLETDPGLGNGGLGRLAACFLDSGASLSYPLHGNCIRYRSGLFKQEINEKGEQVERPDYWLRLGNPWEIHKPKHAVPVEFYGTIETSYDNKGDMHFKHINPVRILAVPYDMGIVGANTKETNTLRLWSAELCEDCGPIDQKKYMSLVDDICDKLYPDDSTDEGKTLRLMQEYFFVSAGIASIVKTHLKRYKTLDNLPEKVAIQMNDTHPVLAIPELMRVLMDDHGYSWADAEKIVRGTLSYTNHTVMAEALEKWPIHILKPLLPRIHMIIQEFDRRYRQYVNEHCNGDYEMVERTAVIRDNQIHMANLAIFGSHHVNGVAEIHSEILKRDLFRDFYKLFPDRFSNKTNGITPRRWMLYANPELAELLDNRIGTGYRTDFNEFEKLMKYVDDEKTQAAFLAVKQQKKWQLADMIKETTGVEVDPNSMFDTQCKRLHAYKRQLLNIMQVIYRYQRIKEDPNYRMPKHTYLFAAKAASSYTFAKKVIKLINCVANVVNNDPDVKGMIKVVFLPNYCVTMAETLIPGTDVSEQISTAGKEASGTGNMKFMMNGAVTIGTMDGANVEIDRQVGPDNDVIFGLHVEDINNMKYSYNSQDYYRNDWRIKKVMDTFINPVWTDDPNDFRYIFDELMRKNDEFFVLADFDAYVKAQEKLDVLYQDKKKWARMCLVNIAKSGYFSSDRTIQEYVEDVWHIEKMKF